MKTFKADKSEKLSKFLLSCYGADLSYSTLRKLIRNKDIKVNGKRVGVDVLLSANDQVIVYYDGERLYTPVFESCDVIVFDKPPTLTSEDFELKLNSQGYNVKLCHRLDRNTQGLLVFAKTDIGYQELLKAFKERTIDKYYLAEVYGKLKEPKKTLTSYLLKNADIGLVQIFDNEVNGSEKIITQYEVVEERERTSVVKVKLITGKTHQIRAHFSHIGNFVIGDGKYGDNEFNKALKAKRQRLVSYLLKFNFDKSSPLNYLNGKEVKTTNIPFIKQ